MKTSDLFDKISKNSNAVLLLCEGYKPDEESLVSFVKKLTKEFIQLEIFALDDELAEDVCEFVERIGMECGIIYNKSDLKDFDNIILVGVSSTEVFPGNSRGKIIAAYFKELPAGSSSRNWSFIDKTLYGTLDEFENKPSETSLQLDSYNEYQALFVNRKDEIQKIKDFLKNHDKSICFVVGMPGLGKTSLLHKSGAKKKCITYTFMEGDDLFNVLLYLLPKAGIAFKDEEIVNFDVAEVLIKEFVKQWDLENDVQIIFRKVHKVYDVAKSKFYNQGITKFFEYIIQRRNPNPKNKIFITADTRIRIKKVTNINATNIELQPLQANFIKEIIANKCSSFHGEEFAKTINRYDNNNVSEIIGGHPYIAELFVAAANIFGIRRLMTDEKFRQAKFDKDKAEYLFKTIMPKKDCLEYKTLELCSLLNDPFDGKLIEICLDIEIEETVELINKLDSMFFLTREGTSEGEMLFEIPSLLKTLISKNISHENRQLYNKNLGNYYWNLAEESMAYARFSFFHFDAAGDDESVRLVMNRLLPKYIEEAIALSKNKKIEKALSAFISLWEIIRAIDFEMKESAWLSFLEVLYKYRTLSEQKITAKYDKEIIQRSENFCKNNAALISVLYVKICTVISFLKKEEREAEERILDYISKIDNEKLILEILLFWFDLIDYFGTYRREMMFIAPSLDSYPNIKEDIFNLLQSPYKEDDAIEVRNLFEWLLKNQPTNIDVIKANYAQFLIRQDDRSEAVKVFGNKPERGNFGVKSFFLTKKGTITKNNNSLELLLKIANSLVICEQAFKNCFSILSLIEQNCKEYSHVLYRKVNFLMSFFDFKLIANKIDSFKKKVSTLNKIPIYSNLVESNEVEFKSTIELPVLSKHNKKEIKKHEESIQKLTIEKKVDAIKATENKINNIHTELAEYKKNKALKNDLHFEILKTVVAFANSNGGTLFIGIDEDIDDSPIITGIEAEIDYFGSLDKLIQKIDEIFELNIGNSFNALFKLSIEEVEEKKIIVVVVSKSDEPIYTKKPKTGDLVFPIRRQTSTALLDPKATVEYIGQHFKTK